MTKAQELCYSSKREKRFDSDWRTPCNTIFRKKKDESTGAGNFTGIDSDCDFCTLKSRLTGSEFGIWPADGVLFSFPALDERRWKVIMMNQILKYPRTRHLEGSREQKGDEDLQCVHFGEIRGKYLVLEEKVDGANCGISFDRSGKMLLQSRGHYLNGGYGEKQFDLFKMWAGCFEDRLRCLLKDRYILYGEWLYAKHTVFYDRLPHYFMEFDIFDKAEGCFFSTRKRKEFLADAPFICSVRVLAQGYYESVEEIAEYIGKSAFISEEKEKNFAIQCRKAGVRTEEAERQTDLSGIMEGIYIKVEDGDYVTDRLKYVRGSFLNRILDSESHWSKRPIVANCLAEGTDLFSAGEGGAGSE